MLIFCDSFDHYVTADLGDKYTTQVGSASTITGSGRNGSGFISGASGSTYHGWRKSLPANYGTVIVGVAMIAPFTPGVQVVTLRLEDGTTTQLDLRVNTDLTLTVARAGATLGTSNASISASSWTYVELRATIANAGSWELRMNGVDETSDNGDTQNTANAYVNAITVGSDRVGMRFDDLYFCDNTNSGVSGAPNNDFLGDVRIECLFPNGNGNSSQFMGSDGNQVDNYLLVDETTPDDDTTYTESSAIGDKDTYAMSNLATLVGTVYALQAVPSAKKDDAGTRTFKSQIRSSGVDDEGLEKSLSTSYAYFPDPFESDSSGNQWTITSVNAIEAGVKVHA